VQRKQHGKGRGEYSKRFHTCQLRQVGWCNVLRGVFGVGESRTKEEQDLKYQNRPIQLPDV
jgi:hypothetical protein